MTNIDLTSNEKAIIVALLEAGIDVNGCDTLDAMQHDNMCLSDVAELATRTGKTEKSVKGILGSLTKKGLVVTEEKTNGAPGVDQWLVTAALPLAFELRAEQNAPIPQPAAFTASDAEVESKVARATKAKSRALFMRKPGREAKTYKAGTRRAEIALALLKGATIDDMRAICVKASGEQWSKNATRAALTTFQVNNGFGIEEREVDGVRRFYLIMPAGMESPVA